MNEDDEGISWPWDVCHPTERGMSVMVRAGESNKNDGTTLFVASTASPDRAMDVVSQNWRLKNFRANPVILDSHNHQRVVGKAVEVTVPKSGDDTGKLMLRVKWDLGSSDKSIAAIGEQHLSGFRFAGSVGFRAAKKTLRSKLPTDHEHFQEPIEVDTPWGKERVSGMLFESPELMEFSSVSLPMNAEALQRGLVSTRRAEGDPAPSEGDADVVLAWFTDAANRTKALDLLVPDLVDRFVEMLSPPPKEAEEAPPADDAAAKIWRSLVLPRLYTAMRNDPTIRRIVAAYPNAGPPPAPPPNFMSLLARKLETK